MIFNLDISILKLSYFHFLLVSITKMLLINIEYSLLKSNIFQQYQLKKEIVIITDAVAIQRIFLNFFFKKDIYIANNIIGNSFIFFFLTSIVLKFLNDKCLDIRGQTCNLFKLIFENKQSTNMFLFVIKENRNSL